MSLNFANRSTSLFQDRQMLQRYAFTQGLSFVAKLFLNALLVLHHRIHVCTDIDATSRMSGKISML